MLCMDHQIAGAESGKLCQKGISIAALGFAPDQPVAQHILLCDELKRCARKAAFNRQDQRCGRSFGRQRQRLLPAFGLSECATRFAQNRGNAGAAAFGIGRKQRLDASLAQAFEMLGQPFVNILAASPVRRKVAARTKAQIDHILALSLSKMRGAMDRELVGGCFELFGA